MSATEVRQEREADRRNRGLVEPQWLQEHLQDAAVQIIEVDVNSGAYDEGHIPGAVLWNVYRDLKDAEYRLADRHAIEELWSRSGISPDSTVVFYGYAPAMGAWLLRLYGHADVRLLNCSRGVWLMEGRPWSSVAPIPFAPHRDLPEEDVALRADLPLVVSAISNPAQTIIDVRSDSEYRGERFWPSGGSEAGGRAGYVPTAVNISIEDLHDARGAFLSEAELRRRFSLIDAAGDNELIVYCTIGGRASTAWFVLTYLLGRERVRVYDGSWAEWGRAATTPVVSG